MAEAPRELVVVITHGMDDERSSIAFTIANGGLTAGLQVSIFRHCPGRAGNFPRSNLMIFLDSGILFRFKDS